MTSHGEGKNPGQRSAICYSMWENRNKTKKGETTEMSMDEFIQMGKKHTTSMHSYPEVPPLPEGFQKPKSYVEILEDEVRGDIPDRSVSENIKR